MAKDSKGHGSAARGSGTQARPASASLNSYFGYDRGGSKAKSVNAIVDKKGAVVTWTTGRPAVAAKSGKYYPEDGHKIVKITAADWAKRSSGGKAPSGNAKRK